MSFCLLAITVKGFLDNVPVSNYITVASCNNPRAFTAFHFPEKEIETVAVTLIPTIEGLTFSAIAVTGESVRSISIILRPVITLSCFGSSKEKRNY